MEGGWRCSCWLVGFIDLCSSSRGGGGGGGLVVEAMVEPWKTPCGSYTYYNDNIYIYACFFYRLFPAFYLPPCMILKYSSYSENKVLCVKGFGYSVALPSSRHALYTMTQPHTQ